MEMPKWIKKYMQTADSLGADPRIGIALEILWGKTSEALRHARYTETHKHDKFDIANFEEALKIVRDLK